MAGVVIVPRGARRPRFDDDRRAVGAAGAAAPAAGSTAGAGAGPRSGTGAWSWTRSSCSAAGSPGGPCRPTSRRIRPSTPCSAGGSARGRGAGSTQRCLNVRVWPTGVAQCRPRRDRLPDRPRRRHRPDRQQRGRRREQEQGPRTSRSTPAGCCWPSWSRPPPCRTATVRSPSPPRCARRSPRSPWCGPTPGTQAGSSATRASSGTWRWRSSSARPGQGLGPAPPPLGRGTLLRLADQVPLPRTRRRDLPATHEAMIWTAATWQLSNCLTR